MKCPKCHSDNPETSTFCADCGTQLISGEEASVSQTKTLEAPTEELSRGTTFAGRYQIIEELGRGGMGVVYKAKDTKLKRTVALKFLPPELTHISEVKERFMREAQAAAALDHPNICTVYEFDEAEEKTFISMAYIEGQSLKKKIESGPLELDKALRIATQVAEGLQEAHKKGIIHRDIKSANIMIDERGQAKIMDFGLARVAGGTLVTKEGMTMGTIAYMSSEQARGEAVDHRSDIWSLGVVLYEMVSGQLPFKGEHDQVVLHSILNQDPKPLADLRTGIPSALEEIVGKAMAKNPEERYQRAEDMLIDLRAVAKEPEIERTKTRLTVKKSQVRKTRISFLKDLLQRRVPQILGIYFLGHFIIIMFMEWLVHRYPLSPHLIEFSTVALASIIPTIILLAYFHGRTGHYSWGRVEKIGIPVNLLVSAVLLFALFQGKDLGATTTKITLTDEEGQTIERVMPKNEFRKKFALFFFENETGDSTLNWLQYAIPGMLGYDLSQDLYLDIKSGYLFHNKMKKAGFSEGIGLPLTLKNKIADDLHMKHFVSGSFTKQNEELSIKTSIFETKRGKLIAESTFDGMDIFKLVDEMSIKLKHDLEIPKRHIEEVKDMPVSEILTNSLPALEQYIAGENAVIFNQDWKGALEYIKQSVKEDPTFALAYFELQAIYMLSNQGEKIAQVIPSLMKHLYKLPERDQLYVKQFYYYNIKQDADKGFNVVKMWVELYPDDIEAHASLAGIYVQMNQLDDAILEYKHILELDPEQHFYLQTIGSVYEQKGEFEEALKYYEQYAEKFPNKYESFTAIGGLYKTMGDYEQAKASYEKALLIEPEKISALLTLADIETKVGNFEQSLKQYQDALKIANTPQDRSSVYEEQTDYYRFRGQIGKALEYFDLNFTEMQKFEPAFSLLLQKLQSMELYVQIGKEDVAFETIEAIKTKLAPPFDKILPFGYLRIYVEIEDADSAERTLEEVETFIQTFQAEALRWLVFLAEGKIHEMRNEYDQAIESYKKKLELDPTDASINTAIGLCYRNLKDFKKAEEFIQKNLKIEPFDPEAHYEIALVYWDMGKKEKALEHLKKALYVWEEADPDYKPAKKAREKLAEWESSNS